MLSLGRSEGPLRLRPGPVAYPYQGLGWVLQGRSIEGLGGSEISVLCIENKICVLGREKSMTPLGPTQKAQVLERVGS